MGICPWLWLIVSKLVACWNLPPIWFWLSYYFLSKAHRHANRNRLFKIPGTTFVVMWFCWFHESFPLTLAYSFKTFRLLKSSSNMILALLLIMFKAHRHANRNLLFKIPGTTFVVMWFCLDYMRMFPWLWLIVSKLVACWDPPPIWCWLYYYFCFKAHRHANRNLLFKNPGDHIRRFVVCFLFH